jgi:nicotinate phosphoribosyltransferase
MAHSYITSFPQEIEAFRVFARIFPKITTLLIDTYDNIHGAHKAVKVAKEMEARGERLGYLRLDSGDIAAISREVRKILDDHGLEYVKILASGGFDEFKIARVLAAGGQVDSFAVGTKMGVSADAPYFDCAYKLVKYGDRPVMKLSTGKVTLVDKKQIHRHYDSKGLMLRDTIALRNEAVPTGAPLLQQFMAGGRVTQKLPTLPESRDFFHSQFALLPESYKALEEPVQFPVDLSPGLRDLQARVEREIHQRESGES